MSEHPTDIGLRLEKTDQHVPEGKCIEVKEIQVLTNIHFLLPISRDTCK